MASIQDLVDLEFQEPVSSYIKTRRQELYSHHVYLDEDIGAPSKYRDFINMLYTADENTEFNVFLNTNGGNLSACMAIVEAIRETDALVRCIITGECHSAGSIIALNCHEIVVTQSALMMIHTANYGSAGTTQNVKACVDFSTNYINKIMADTYTNFLTNDELKQVMSGVEIWLNAEEIMKRQKNKLEMIEKKIKARKNK
jgi:ATP-dependent protease ClpP protease subunit